MTDNCTTCRFSRMIEDTLFCCFDPPEFVPPNGSISKPVRAEGWCGKYEKVQKRKTTTKAPSSAS